MRSSTRHQLKQDQFTQAATGTVHWAVEHRQKLVWGGGLAAAALVIAIGAWLYMGYRENQATEAMGMALLTYNAPLRTGQEPTTAAKSFATAEERSKAAQAEFSRVAEQYSGSPSGKLARYFAGVTAAELHDTAAAEREFTAVMNSANPELASLAKLALAGVYQDSGRPSDAMRLYNELADHPTRTVPKSAAQLELAELLATNQPDQARTLLEQIAKENPSAAAGQIAQTRLQGLK
ncbi:MAG: tetratricopeptide repeat protein [Candidatus Korobacteraceae bacterium]